MNDRAEDRKRTTAMDAAAAAAAAAGAPAELTELRSVPSARACRTPLPGVLNRVVRGAWGGTHLATRYRDGLLAFVREVLKKMQFKYNGRDLDGIFDVVEDAEVRACSPCVCAHARGAHAPAGATVVHATRGAHSAPLNGTATSRTA
jgi:hypothetical protein